MASASVGWNCGGEQERVWCRPHRGSGRLLRMRCRSLRSGGKHLLHAAVHPHPLLGAARLGTLPWSWRCVRCSPEERRQRPGWEQRLAVFIGRRHVTAVGLTDALSHSMKYSWGARGEHGRRHQNDLPWLNTRRRKHLFRYISRTPRVGVERCGEMLRGIRRGAVCEEQGGVYDITRPPGFDLFCSCCSLLSQFS